MQESFEKLKKDGKNSLDGLIHWMKESKIISQPALKEHDVRKAFEKVNSEAVDAAKFKEILTKMAKDDKKAAAQIQQFLSQKESEINRKFTEMKNQGNSSVDSIIKWLQDGRVIVESAISETEVRKMFEGVDPKNVEYEKFKEVISGLAERHHGSFEQFQNLLVDQANRFYEALLAGAEAMQKALHQKQ